MNCYVAQMSVLSSWRLCHILLEMDETMMAEWNRNFQGQA
jgi:hypothetical protein